MRMGLVESRGFLLESRGFLLEGRRLRKVVSWAKTAAKGAVAGGALGAGKATLKNALIKRHRDKIPNLMKAARRDHMNAARKFKKSGWEVGKQRAVRNARQANKDFHRARFDAYVTKPHIHQLTGQTHRLPVDPAKAGRAGAVIGAGVSMVARHVKNSVRKSIERARARFAKNRAKRKNKKITEGRRLRKIASWMKTAATGAAVGAGAGTVGGGASAFAKSKKKERDFRDIHKNSYKASQAYRDTTNPKKAARRAARQKKSEKAYTVAMNAKTFARGARRNRKADTKAGASAGTLPGAIIGAGTAVGGRMASAGLRKLRSYMKRRNQ